MHVFKPAAPRLAALALALASASGAWGEEPRDIPPEVASDAAPQIEQFPPQREAEGIRLLGQDADNVYATGEAGEMPSHNDLIRYIRSAHANAAEIKEGATQVEEVLLVDVSSLFEGESGANLEEVLLDNAERVAELQKVLQQSPEALAAFDQRNVSSGDAIAVQLEASGVMTAYVR